MIEIKIFLKYTISWNVTPCIPIDIYERFEGKHCLLLQGRKKKPSKKLATDCIPEDSTLHGHLCDVLRTNTEYSYQYQMSVE
jgi:hypothetical protein